MGRELALKVVALMHWGDRHLAGDAGRPRLTRHRTCGGELRARLVCEACGEVATAEDLQVLPGPGLPPGAAAGAAQSPDADS